MTPENELGALVFIGGFLLFFEGLIIYIAKSINNRVSEHMLKIIAGSVIIIIGVLYITIFPALFLKTPTH